MIERSLTPGLISKLAMRCCVLGKDTSCIFSFETKQSNPQWWRSLRKDFQSQIPAKKVKQKPKNGGQLTRTFMDCKEEDRYLDRSNWTVLPTARRRYDTSALQFGKTRTKNNIRLGKKKTKKQSI